MSSKAEPSLRPLDRDAARPPILVLGIGNVLLRDEGVGVHVIEALRGQARHDGVELLDGGTAGFDLVEAIADRQKVIVIDAMDAGAQPGTIWRLGIDDLCRETSRSVSLHEFGLLDALHAAALLGCAPQEVVCFGVQPGEIRLALELSDAVAACVPRLVAMVAEEIETSQNAQRL